MLQKICALKFAYVTAAAAIAAPAVGFFCGLFYFTLRNPLRFFKIPALKNNIQVEIFLRSLPSLFILQE